MEKQLWRYYKSAVLEQGGAEVRDFDTIDTPERERGITINTSHVEYETEIDITPRRLSGPLTMLRTWLQECSNDGAILVCVTDGPILQTEHIYFDR